MTSDIFITCLRYLNARNLGEKSPEENDGNVKLADFGLAVMGITHDEAMDPSTITGTPDYMAPEMLLREHYGRPVDCWALGVITYIILCGFPPFYPDGDDMAPMFENIKRGKFRFLEPYWDKVSDSAKDLVLKLLDPSPRRRELLLPTIPWWGRGRGSPEREAAAYLLLLLLLT